MPHKASSGGPFCFSEIEQFLSRPSSSFSAAFNPRHCNQDLSDEVRELARQGLKLFPVSLAAKLAEDPDRLIAAATDDVCLLDELAAAAGPLWGYRVALARPAFAYWFLPELSAEPRLPLSFPILKNAPRFKRAAEM